MEIFWSLNDFESKPSKLMSEFAGRAHSAPGAAAGLGFQLTPPKHGKMPPTAEITGRHPAFPLTITLERPN